MKGKSKLLFLFSLFLLITSCAKSKDNYIREYERHINEVKVNHNNYNERDWAKSDRHINHLHTVIGRYEKRLTAEDKERIAKAFSIYRSYRSGIDCPFIETKIADNQEKEKNENSAVDSTDAGAEALKRLTEQQEQIASELEALRKKITEEFKEKNNSSQVNEKQKTDKEFLIDKLQNELLQKILNEKKEGRRKISGRIKVLIFPANFKNNIFRMNYNDLTEPINKAVKIIISQAKKYNQYISIDWEFMGSSNGSFVSLDNYIDGLNEYTYYQNMFSNYDYLVTVYAVDKQDRSYCGLSGSLGRSNANTVIWFKDIYHHSAGTLAHEIFHTFGAEDLYYEEGVVPKEVEANFKKLLGNSIMITSNDSAELDPINAWLMGWNDKPELWYAWFVDRRNNTGDGLNLVDK